MTTRIVSAVKCPVCRLMTAFADECGDSQITALTATHRPVIREDGFAISGKEEDIRPEEACEGSGRKGYVLAVDYPLIELPLRYESQTGRDSMEDINDCAYTHRYVEWLECKLKKALEQMPSEASRRLLAESED